MRLLVIFLACGLALQLAGCDKSMDSMDGDITNTPLSDQNLPSESEREEGNTVHPTDQSNAALSQGSLTVFGLALPKGTTPLAGPNKVYRFENRYSTSTMFENIERQVSAKNIGPEGDGYLIREASVRNPRGSAKGDEIIALRIKKRNKGGSIIDIWLEKSYERAIRNRDSTNVASALKQEPKPVRASTVWKKQTRDSRRQTLKVMGKISRGEELSESDLKSPAFN